MNSWPNFSKLLRDVGAAWTFALAFPTLLTWTYFVALAGHDGQGPSTAFRTVYSMGKAIQFTFPLFCFWCLQSPQLRLGAPSWRGLTTGLGFGLFVAAAILGLYFAVLRQTSVFDVTRIQLRSKVEQFGALSVSGFVTLACWLTLLHSLLEEYYWRWFVFGWLKRYMPLTLAIVISSLGFMAHHVVVLHVYFPGRFLDAVVPFSLGIAIGGAAWAWLYDRTGSIYAPWISHLLVDAAIMVVGFDLLFGG